MKYIFVIQGEGRGHLTQALALSSLLRGAGHSVVEVLVGRCRNRRVPQFFREKIEAPLRLYNAPTLDYGRAGKQASSVRTFVRNFAPFNMSRWVSSTKFIAERIQKSGAEVVINFYELLMGPTKIMHSIDLPIISIGHQFLLGHPEIQATIPQSAEAMMLRLNNAICGYGSMRYLALSFYPLRSLLRHRIDVVPPLLRSEIFEQEVEQEDFVLGYTLNPSYQEEVLKWKKSHPESKVHLFWDKSGAAEVEEPIPGLWLHKINDVEFLRLMARCKGYVTTAGFESVCEALYLGKPAVMIPAHVEQQINASDAESIGAGVASSNFDLSILEGAIENYSADTEAFRQWVDSARERFLELLTDVD